jgi:hypothetical protein
MSLPMKRGRSSMPKLNAFLSLGKNLVALTIRKALRG